MMAVFELKIDHKDTTKSIVDQYVYCTHPFDGIKF